MITAIDTSVLFDIYLPDPAFREASLAAVRLAYIEGPMVICEPVYAELAARFPSRQKLDAVLQGSEIRVEPVSLEAAWEAGHRFRAYRTSGGKRDRIITDFLIGAHALKRASRLLSRDRGFYRACFRGLRILDPARG
jgi:predicted nucleic acid-binding protein